jgi:oligopeptide transport system substrate-binding protein
MRLATRIATVAAVVVAAAGTAGCGSSDSTSTRGATGTAVGSGGKVTFGAVEPDYLTPNRSGIAFDEAHALFTPLMLLNEQNELRNGVAKSITPAEGGRVWTITIKDGWTFHDGEPVTAHSFVDAWNATAYGPNAWGNNGQLANIKGYPELNPAKGTPKVKTLSGLKVLSPTRFQVTLIKPDSQFPLQVTAQQLGFYPLPKVAFRDPKAYNLAPVGNGPFKMVGKFKPNQGLTVERWNGYKGTAPQVDQIEFRVYTDLHTAYNDVLGGNLDISLVGDDQLAKAVKDFPNRLGMYDAPSIDNLGIPLYDSRFKDVRLRQAISMAIDRDAISKALYGGLVSPATDWVPNSVPGARDVCRDHCRFDPAAAKALLEEAGGWSGGKLTIWFPSGFGFEPLFQAVGNSIRQALGIEVAFKATAGFGPFLQARSERTVDGLSRSHWGALYPSMENVLTALYTRNGDDYYAYSNPEVEALLLKGRAAPSADEAITYYQQADDQVATDFPTIPLFTGKYVYAYSQRMEGVSVDINGVDLSRLRIKG